MSAGNSVVFCFLICYSPQRRVVRRKTLLAIFSVLVVLVGVVFYLFQQFREEPSGIMVDANPSALIYIDNIQVGNTPYKAQRVPGEITLRLVTESGQSWSTKLTLVSGIETVIERDFGQAENQSSGQVLSFEKIPSGSASLTVVSSPDASQIMLDGQVVGVTPLPLNNLTEGDHKIVVSQPGYTDREIDIKTRSGYKLTVVATLAQEEQKIQVGIANEASADAQVRQKIEIQSTPTGYLRVRAAPNRNASEEGQVKPGETYDLLEQSPQSDWYKIEYESGKQGWISSSYAKILNN